MGKEISKSEVHLRPGDLIINKISKEAGVLMQKHKVLRSYERPVKGQRSHWYYAWRIRWNKDTSKVGEINWSDRLESTYDESKLLQNIDEGLLDHYSKKEDTCN